MKFEKKKVPDLATGGQRTVYEADRESAPGGFVIAVSGTGIRVAGDGLDLTGAPDLEAFAKAIGLAWKDHRAIRQGVVDALASRGGPA